MQKFFLHIIPSALFLGNLAACGSDSSAVKAIDENNLSSNSALYQELSSSDSAITSETSEAQAFSSETGLPQSSSTEIHLSAQSSSSIAKTDKPIETDDNENTNIDATATTLTLSTAGATLTNDNGCVIRTSNTATITCSGKYNLSGSTTDFQVIVNVASAADTASVELYLNNVNLKSSSDAPLFVQNAEKTVIHVVKGTTNTIEDAASRNGPIAYTTPKGDKSDTTKAAIYAKDDLTIKGSGTLAVKANFSNGVHTSNDLKIKNGKININAKNNGLKGKGSVHISGGTINVTTTEGDGIKSDECNTVAGTDSCASIVQDKGFVEITGGTVTIKSAKDGIYAENYVRIADSDDSTMIEIESGDGQTCLNKNGNSQGGMGGFGGGFGRGGGMGGGGNSCAASSSMKGIKGGENIFIEGGSININSHDDGVHSNKNISISGGNLTIATDDDGIHAEDTLAFKDNAYVNVTMAYEGFEAYQMNFDGGVTSVNTTDDGWNAAGGGSSATSTSTNQGKQGGRGGRGGFGGGSSIGYINVSGGYHHVKVGSGDTDGIDSNKDISITGGVIIIECQMNGGMGGMMDSDGNTSITGGIVMGFGTGRSEEGTQYSVRFTTDSYYGSSDKVAFKPSFSGSYMISNFGQPTTVTNVTGMNETCFDNKKTICVYTK